MRLSRHRAPSQFALARGAVLRLCDRRHGRVRFRRRVTKVARANLLPVAQATTIITCNDPFNLEPTTLLSLIKMPSPDLTCARSTLQVACEPKQFAGEGRLAEIIRAVRQQSAHRAQPHEHTTGGAGRSMREGALCQ